MTFQELARRLGVRKDDLRDWLRKRPELPDALTRKKGEDALPGKFKEREVPEPLEAALLAGLPRIARDGGSKRRLRNLGDVVDIPGLSIERPDADASPEQPIPE